MSDRRLTKGKNVRKIWLHQGCPNAPGLINLWTRGNPTTKSKWRKKRKKYKDDTGPD